MIQVVKVVCAALLWSQVATAQQEVCGMTPMTLEADFLRSCRSLVGGGAIDCTQAWQEFGGAFAGVSPESVTSSDYEAYFNVLPITVMADESLFWTRTSSLVGILSMMNAMGVRVVSSMSETVLSSEIINSITPEGGTINWCGNQDGIDFESNCLCSVTGQFWNRFSVEFAQAANGDIFYLSDGQAEGGAFRSSSFFATVELPNLIDSNVSRLIALIIHEEGEGDSCSGMSASVEMLRDLVSNRDFTFDCYDIFGSASDSSQTQAIASCIQNVVDKVQRDMEDTRRQIPCAGTSAFQMSVALLLGILFVHFT